MNTNNKRVKFAILATDAVVFTIIERQLHVLLIKVKSPSFSGMWAFPGGLVDPKELAKNAILRYLTNIPNSSLAGAYFEQLATFDNPKRDPAGRVISVAFMVLIPPKVPRLFSNKAFVEAKWIPASKMPFLAYDHNKMLKAAIDRIKSKLEYTNIIYSLMPKEFTLTNLQKTYEEILERKLDKRNFRKKIFFLDLVQRLGKKEKGEPHRPAVFYKFKNNKYKVMELI